MTRQRNGDFLPDKPPEQLSSLANLRGPHRETRIVVDAEGHDFVKGLYQAFDYYNATFFEGKLAEPFILVAPTKSPRAMGDATAADYQGIRSPIRIHPNVFKKGGPELCLDVLLHEMVHVWQYEVIKDLEIGYQYHGPRFTMMCNDITDRMRALGMPELTSRVGCRGRKGLPSSSQWPVNVRPPGYYQHGYTFKARTRKVLSEGGEAPADAEEAAGATATPAPPAPRRMVREPASGVLVQAKALPLVPLLPRLLREYSQQATRDDEPEISKALRIAADYLRRKLNLTE